jgi:hypothetical protein
MSNEHAAPEDDPMPEPGKWWEMLFWMHRQGKIDLEARGFTIAGPVPVKQQAHRLVQDNPVEVSEN